MIATSHRCDAVIAPRPGPLAVSLLVLLLAVGCGAPPAVPSADPATIAATPELDSATAAAIDFRTSFGLRSDLDFVRAVAADKTASTEFGVPLLPAEVAEIKRRGANADRVVGIVNRYAAEHPEVFGGLWIDQQQGGIVTVVFTRDVELHTRALMAQLVGVGIVAIRSAGYNEAELRQLQDRIAADSAWFKSIPARLQGVGVDPKLNAVEIVVSTANPLISDLMVARFGIPPDAIVVISDGTGIALEPWGRIKGKVVGIRPDVLVELTLQYNSDRIGAECGMGDVGIGIAPDGSFELPWVGTGQSRPDATSTTSSLKASSTSLRAVTRRSS